MQTIVVLNNIVHVLFLGEALLLMALLLVHIPHQLLIIRLYVQVKLEHVLMVHWDDLIQILVVLFDVTANILLMNHEYVLLHVDDEIWQDIIL